MLAFCFLSPDGLLALFLYHELLKAFMHEVQARFGARMIGLCTYEERDLALQVWQRQLRLHASFPGCISLPCMS